MEIRMHLVEYFIQHVTFKSYYKIWVGSGVGGGWTKIHIRYYSLALDSVSDIG